MMCIKVFEGVYLYYNQIEFFPFNNSKKSMLWQIWIFCGVMKNWMRKGGLFFILFNFFILEFSKYGTSLTIFTLKYKYLSGTFFPFQNYSTKYSSHRSAASSANNILHASLRPSEFFKSSCFTTKASLERRLKKSSRVTIISRSAASVSSHLT